MLEIEFSVRVSCRCSRNACDTRLMHVSWQVCGKGVRCLCAGLYLLDCHRCSDLSP